MWTLVIFLIHQNIFQFGSCCCSFCPHQVSHCSAESSLIQHGSHASIQGCKCSFNLSILLGCVSCSVFKFYTPLFFYKSFICTFVFTSIITPDEFYLETCFSFHFIYEGTHHFCHITLVYQEEAPFKSCVFIYNHQPKTSSALLCVGLDCTDIHAQSFQWLCSFIF